MFPCNGCVLIPIMWIAVSPGRPPPRLSLADLTPCQTLLVFFITRNWYSVFQPFCGGEQTVFLLLLYLLMFFFFSSLWSYLLLLLFLLRLYYVSPPIYFFLSFLVFLSLRGREINYLCPSFFILLISSFFFLFLLYSPPFLLHFPFPFEWDIFLTHHSYHSSWNNYIGGF